MPAKNNKRGLGRGFDALIPSELLDESFDPTANQDNKTSDLRTIQINEIHADASQPRRHFDTEALDELAHSVKQHGIIQPIVVMPRKEGGYTIVAGERRYRAAKQVQLGKIPAIVRTLGAQHKLELALVENLQRRDLNAIEAGTAYMKLRDQFNLTMDEIGQRVGGKSASAITNTMRLLKLPDEIKDKVAAGLMTEGQARPLVNVPEAQALELYPKIIAEAWTARRIEAVIAALRSSDKVKDAPKVSSVANAEYMSAAKGMTAAFKAPVKVKTNPTGTGTISISFKNEKDFKRITELLDQNA